MGMMMRRRKEEVEEEEKMRRRRSTAWTCYVDHVPPHAQSPLLSHASLTTQGKKQAPSSYFLLARLDQ